MPNTNQTGQSVNSFMNCDPNAVTGSILQIANNNTGIDGTLRTVYDASGNAAPFQISSSIYNVTGTFQVGGKTIILPNNFTISGNYALTLTLTNTTNVTLPSSGTLSTLNGNETLTNKTLTTPIISSISNTGTLTLPTSTDTLIGKATVDILTNKTFDTAGTGNSFKINGTAITANTGTGNNVLANSPALTTPNLGVPSAIDLTNATNLVAGGIAANSGGGIPVQFQQTQVTTNTTVSSATFADITSLSVAITPTASTSKILVRAVFYVSPANANDIMQFRLMRGATPIGVGTSTGSRTACTGALYTLDAGAGQIFPVVLEWLDSPATTSSTTYKVQGLTAGANTFAVASTITDTNSGAFPRCVSVISVMEIK